MGNERVPIGDDLQGREAEQEKVVASRNSQRALATTSEVTDGINPGLCLPSDYIAGSPLLSSGLETATKRRGYLLARYYEPDEGRVLEGLLLLLGQKLDRGAA
jgi:hypothetical protein